MSQRKKYSIKEVRTAVADYMRSEGCSCCRNIEAHDRNKAKLGEMLDVPEYSDGSGYDFGKFETGAQRDGEDRS